MDDSSNPNKKSEPAQVNEPTEVGGASVPVFKSEVVEPEEIPTQPEEVSPDVVAPNSSDFHEGKPEIPTDVPPPVYEENKSKYFIIGGAVVFFVILLFIFMKLIFGRSTTTQKISLTYWGLWEDKEIFDPLIQQYEKQNPNVSITYEKMSPQDYREKLLTRSAESKGPDIFRFHNTWLPEIQDVASALPESVMTATDYEKTFYPVTKTDLKVGNFYYGIPLMIDGLVLVSNENLLKKAGIASPPVTWDEVTDAVSRLTVKDKSGTIITSGIALGTASNIEHFSDVLGLMLAQNGASLGTLDKEEAAGALQSYRAFAEEPNGYWNESFPNSINAFAQEKVAMIIVPSWELLSIKGLNPDLSIRVSAVPYVPGGTPNTIASYWVEGVSKYSKNQLAAWKFLAFLAQKDNMSKLYEIESRLRPFGEPYSRIDLAETLVKDPYIGPVISQADKMVSMPLISRTFDNGLNDEIIKYLENAVNSSIQGVSYQSSFATAKQGVDQVFKKYNIQ